MDKARIMKALDAVKSARVVLTDEQAAEVPDLYKAWEPDRDYAAGERLTHSGALYKVLQAHTSQAGWEPDAAPSLFAKLLPGQGGTEVGEWEQPDSTNGYNTGDRCRFEGEVYESTIDNNVGSPADYPAGWKKIG